MKNLAIRPRHTLNLKKLSCALISVLMAASALAVPIRVTTWDLEPKTTAGSGTTPAELRRDLMRQAAETLRQLNPDVIILQSVPDWTACSELLKALKPAKYNLASWSSFHDARTQRLSERQTVILAKGRAYLSWSEDWKRPSPGASPGGFAFAAVKAEGRNIGFISVQLS